MRSEHPISFEISFWSIALAFLCLFAYFFCCIDPLSQHVWYEGIWHGIFFVPNLILSLFTEHRYKSNDGTTAYNIIFWITAVSVILYIIALQFDDMKKNYN